MYELLLHRYVVVVVIVVGIAAYEWKIAQEFFFRRTKELQNEK